VRSGGFDALPISYEIDSASSMIRFELAGTLRSTEIIDALAQLRGDPDLERGMDILGDHSRLENFATTDLVLRTLPHLGRLVEALGPFRCAVVAPRDAQFGMVNVAIAYAQKYPDVRIRPFRSRDEAEAWLAEASGDRNPGAAEAGSPSRTSLT